MSFLIYDLIFLVFFLIIISLFLYPRRKNLKRDGLFYLYRTSWGIKLIEKIGKKYPKTMKFFSYVSVISGYILMVGAFYLVYTIVKVYLFVPGAARAIKVPPIMPLVPYLPQVFNLNFLPPFYFTYWILIIAVIAITHEIAHGIFAAHNEIKIKKTGFGFFPFFLPIFLAAFVELDEKTMKKKNNFSQMAILGAGTLANLITAFLFFIVLVLFFYLAFSPTGIIYDNYAMNTISVAGIYSMNNISLKDKSYQDIINNLGEKNLIEINFENKTYLATKEMLQVQDENEIFVYEFAPAIKNNLSRIILEINNVKINNLDILTQELSKYSPNQEIMITTFVGEEIFQEKIILGEHPEKQGFAWLGIGFFSHERKGIMGKITELITIKNPNIYYSPRFDGISVFLYNLLWWIVMISLSVALINMLPIGAFDGGRFFYLTVLSLTKNEKIAKKSFVVLTQLFILLMLILLIFWVFTLF